MQFKALTLSLGLTTALLSSAGSSHAGPVSSGSSSSSSAGIIRWQPSDKSTIIAGSGCEKNVDAFAFANGRDVTVVFANLGIYLPKRRGTGALAERKTCAIRLPTELPANYFVSKLEQQFAFGVHKSENSSVSISVRSGLFGLTNAPNTVNIPRGYDLDDTFLAYSREDAFSSTSDWRNAFCASGRPEKGMFQVNIAISAKRDSAAEEVIAFVDGIGLRYDVLASIGGC